MSNMFWQEQLKTRLNKIPRNNCPPRIALVGVGNTLRGDDGVGVLLVRDLIEFFEESSNVFIIEAGSAPENITGYLRNFEPDFILFIDAAQMGKGPGEVGIWSYSECGGNQISTHGLPLSLLCAYLEAEMGCTIAVLGIQPFDIGFERQISEQVAQAFGEVVTAIVSVICEVIGTPICTKAGKTIEMVGDSLEI